jgi:nucleoside-diphosphate-sugar epimerase
VSRARVLLLGASGFLGSQIAAALRADERVGDLLCAGRTPAGPDWIRHDLVRDPPGALTEVLRETRPAVVVNAAGRLSGSTEECVQANVVATARLLDAVGEAVPGGRLVVLGSAAEYGVVPRGRAVAEDAPTRPVGTYGVTRLASTQLVQLAAEQGRVDAVALRVFNPVGPGVPTENVVGRAAEAMAMALARGDDHIVLGPLDAYRDFVDVRDVATAVAAAGLADRPVPPVLNVGSGRAVTVRRAVEVLAEVAGFSGRIRQTAAAPARSRGVDWIAADLSRIRQALRWSPRHPLEETLRAVWQQAAATAGVPSSALTV